MDRLRTSFFSSAVSAALASGPMGCGKQLRAVSQVLSVESVSTLERQGEEWPEPQVWKSALSFSEARPAIPAASLFGLSN